MEDFIRLVEEMRRMQRAYFCQRSYETLQKANLLEDQVDTWIRRYREKRGKRETQGKLF